ETGIVWCSDAFSEWRLSKSSTQPLSQPLDQTCHAQIGFGSTIMPIAFLSKNAINLHSIQLAKDQKLIALFEESKFLQGNEYTYQGGHGAVWTGEQWIKEQLFSAGTRQWHWLGGNRYNQELFGVHPSHLALAQTLILIEDKNGYLGTVVLAPK